MALGFRRLIFPQPMKLWIAFFVSMAIAPLVSAQVPAAVRIEMKCNDEMKFNQSRFEVTVGQKVTLVLTNTGSIPAAKMAHNLVILKPDTRLVDFAAQCGDAKAGYLPEDPEMKKRIFAHTRRIGGGESHTIYFIPKEPGSYPYLCTTPGHFSEMQGTMVVKPAAAAP